MSLADSFKNLDPNNPGSWPLVVQAVAGSVVCGLLIFGGWKLDISKQVEALVKVEKKEVDLRTTFEEKQAKAANLDKLKEQMKQMELSFGDMLRQLPNKTEVAGLIVDISQSGLAAGLEFELFQPQGEKPTEFYAELPIKLEVSGTYHQFGEFISRIASLARIVTTHNISITKGGGKGKGSAAGPLKMSATAKTYRALEEES